MSRNKHKNNNEKIHRALDEHKAPNGYVDINNMIYEMHGVISTDTYAQISKAHKYI